MEEEIVYYLFSGKDISVFRKIYEAFSLKSLQTEIFIEGDNHWISMLSLDDFINSYKKGNYATVSYSVNNDADINMISFSYTFDGFLLVGFSVTDSYDFDQAKIEYVFADIKFLGKKETVEEMPFKTAERFYK